jgi:hypothetical protein
MKTKTLREHLMARDAAAAPRLDAMREALVANLATEATRLERRESPGAGFAPTTVLRALWRELVQPYRGSWATVAAVWVLLLGATRWESAGEERPRLTEAEFASLLSGLRESRSFAMETGGARENVAVPIEPQSVESPKGFGRGESSWIVPGRMAEGRC